MSAVPKEGMIRSAKVLRSAKDQPCTAQFPGICNADATTTVWAHLNGHAFGKGAWVKAHDVLGFHACYACHVYYDVGHGTRPLLSDLDLVQMVFRAVCDTWVRLIKMKIIFVPQDPERLSSERPTPKRKPPEARKKITSKTEWPEGRKMQSRGFQKAPV